MKYQTVEMYVQLYKEVYSCMGKTSVVQRTVKMYNEISNWKKNFWCKVKYFNVM